MKPAPQLSKHAFDTATSHPCSSSLQPAVVECAANGIHGGVYGSRGPQAPDIPCTGTIWGLQYDLQDCFL